jgi:hypothetical protein
MARAVKALTPDVLLPPLVSLRVHVLVVYVTPSASLYFPHSSSHDHECAWLVDAEPLGPICSLPIARKRNGAKHICRRRL